MAEQYSRLPRSPKNLSLSRLKESNGRAGAKPAISISVYRPETLAQTLNAAKCSPSLCATFDRAWYVELEPEFSSFVAFAMKLETTNEPRFLEVEEAKRFLLLIAHCGFSSPTMPEVRLVPSYACVNVRRARRIGAFRPIRHADIGASQAHDATLRGCFSSNRR
jgi:hypothetical protein